MAETTTQIRSDEPHEFVAFHVGDQTFCIDIMAVREIRGWTPATPLPHSPSFVRGVINLRGTVLPVVDLASRLGMRPKEPTARHAIIVVQHSEQVVGLLVDAVSNILMIPPDSIQPMPDVASEQARSLVKGIVAVEKAVISVLVVKNLLPPASQLAA